MNKGIYISYALIRTMPKLRILRKDGITQRYNISNRGAYTRVRKGLYARRSTTQRELVRRITRKRVFWVSGAYGAGYERVVAVRITAPTRIKAVIIAGTLEDIGGPRADIKISQELPDADDFYEIRGGELGNINTAISKGL